MLPASAFSIFLGLHDRRKIKEPTRFKVDDFFPFDHEFSIRRQIRIREIFVHGGFENFANDIALLKLGTLHFKRIHFISINCYHHSDDWVDLSLFSPVCLPDNEEDLGDHQGPLFGHVFGELAFVMMRNFPFSQVGEIQEL